MRLPHGAGRAMFSVLRRILGFYEEEKNDKHSSGYLMWSPNIGIAPHGVVVQRLQKCQVHGRSR